MRLTERQRGCLKLVADGGYLCGGHMPIVFELERKGLIEEVKTGFISQVSLRITEKGRAALAQSVEKQ